MEKKDSYDNVEAPSRGGRRERRQPLTDNLDMTTTGAESKADGKNDTEVPESKPRGRRRNADGQQSSSSGGGGGWMSSSSTKGNNAQISLNTDDDDNNKDNQVSGNRDKHFQDDNDEIILIPDLDEDGGVGTDKIAHAPKNVNRKIPTLADLEKELKAAVPNAVDGYNLTVLLATLVPSSTVQEEDVAWTFESLLREITDEISNTPKTVINAIPNTTVPDNTTTTTTTTSKASSVTNNHNSTTASSNALSSASNDSTYNEGNHSLSRHHRGGRKLDKN